MGELIKHVDRLIEVRKPYTQTSKHSILTLNASQECQYLEALRVALEGLGEIKQSSQLAGEKSLPEFIEIKEKEISEIMGVKDD